MLNVLARNFFVLALFRLVLKTMSCLPHVCIFTIEERCLLFIVSSPGNYDELPGLPHTLHSLHVGRLLYFPLVFPASWLLDRWGLRLAVLLGSFGNSLGAWLKCPSAQPDRFWLTFVAQTIVGASQIFTLGIPPRLAAVWFGSDQVSTACALGVFGNQVRVPRTAKRTRSRYMYTQKTKSAHSNVSLYR